MRPGLLCPGKVTEGRRKRPTTNRFNEAGAVMPRKGDQLPLADLDQRWASMRPGLLCPGKGAAGVVEFIGGGALQ